MPEEILDSHVDTTVGSSDATPKEDPAHVAAMLAKVDGGTDTSGAAKLLAGKYKTPADLAKGTQNILKTLYGDDPEAAYKALESELGKRSSPKATPKEEAVKPVEEKVETPAGAVEPTPPLKPGEQVDYTRFTNEFVNDGKLSEESFQILEGQGFTRDMVNTYVAGIQTQVDSVFNRAGGKDNYFAMTEWAKTNLAAGEVSAFNKAIKSNDMGSITLAVDALSSKFTKAVGKGPSRRIVPEEGNTSFTTGYNSNAEMIRDMKDPRYATDPAFRESVVQRTKLAMSAKRL